MAEPTQKTESAPDQPQGVKPPSAVRPATEPHESADDKHHHGDTTVIFGKEYPLPLYTSVFLALGALTLTEVLIAELLAGVTQIKIPLLLAIASAKAFLVVYFYMHLDRDSRAFAVALVVPFLMALLATVYLLSVPAGAY
ncbi:MAG: cytochrome C oxidase subunit IV family protein [Phototrophicaceae bacterium]